MAVLSLLRSLEEGERVLAPTQRPDGTFRKTVRIRASYVPQEEVAIYQSRGALWRKQMAALQEVPPGYDHVLDVKPNTKSAKRNDRKKEKRLQASLDKGINSGRGRIEMVGDFTHQSEPVTSLARQLDALTLSGTYPAGSVQDIDKRIWTLKKKGPTGGRSTAEEWKRKT